MDAAQLIRECLEVAASTGLLHPNKDRDLFDLIGVIIPLLSLLLSLVGVALTYWLVSVVQNGINDRRLLKDHFIREILDIRKEYFALLTDLQSGRVKAKQVALLFQRISVRVEDLVPIVSEEFPAATIDLLEYHVNLLSGVTSIDEYERKFPKNLRIFTTIRSRQALHDIQSESIGAFNSLIRQINNSA